MTGPDRAMCVGLVVVVVVVGQLYTSLRNNIFTYVSAFYVYERERRKQNKKYIGDCRGAGVGCVDTVYTSVHRTASPR